MIWVEDDHSAGWSCPHCNWALSAFRLDTTIAALAYNRTTQQGFEQHDCIANTQKVKAKGES
jgi:hypothetical protein